MLQCTILANTFVVKKNMEETLKNGELTEKQMRRLEILRNYKQNERAKGSYNPEEGIYDVIISNISLRENINGNPFIQVMCLNKDKKGCKRLYASYYLTDGTDDSSITELRCLLSEYEQDDFKDEEVINDYSIMERMQVLIGETAQIVIENQDGFMNGRLYREVPSE
ncbi:MAG: hypothetical protein IJ068_05525 [Bacilli bacterium]|nr:hypothetical protein [Bacilli bacterium]